MRYIYVFTCNMDRYQRYTHTHKSMLEKHEDAFQSPYWRNGHITPRSELKWNKCIEVHVH